MQADSTATTAREALVVEAEGRTALHYLAFRLAYPLLHSARVMGYAPLLLASLARWPRRTLSAVACYYTLRFRSPTWRHAVVGVAGVGSSRRPKLLRCQARPYANRQYLVASHPHGILNYGWWNLIARFGAASLLDGLSLVMCMAPAVQWRRGKSASSGYRPVASGEWLVASG